MNVTKYGKEIKLARNPSTASKTLEQLALHLLGEVAYPALSNPNLTVETVSHIWNKLGEIRQINYLNSRDLGKEQVTDLSVLYQIDKTPFWARKPYDNKTLYRVLSHILEIPETELRSVPIEWLNPLSS